MGSVIKKPAARPIPERYEQWTNGFWEQVRAQLRDGVRVLDVGSGARPTIPMAERPGRCLYVGLDLSEAELRLAPEGAYDETVVSNITERVPRLEGAFDLIVSWQVLEHVRPLELAFEALHSYLRPGGQMVALFSGRFSAQGITNLMIPSRVSAKLVPRLARRDPATVFPAFYDGCYADALHRMLAAWTDVRLQTQWGGATYFNRWPGLQRAYLKYEDWALRTGRDNLATHYLLIASR